jgi:pilus assembly protein CpaF
MAGIDLPLEAVREQIRRGIDVLVHQERDADGLRRIVTISELDETSRDGYLLREVRV